VDGTRAQERFHAPLTGVRLGRYVLGERLGAGGAASVHLAALRGPHDFARVLAVKVVHEHLTESSEFVQMFLDEANLAVRLTHPSIVHSYELGRHGPYLFLAMEYLSGQPLSKLVQRARQRGERLDPRIVAWMGARAAEALAYAHALTDESGKRVALVHRDVSPQNLFLTYDGQVKVIDFGIARAEGRLTHTGLGRIKGKFSYMAPEQMLKQSVDHRADLFALGATLYEAAVGARPFEADDEAEAIAMLLEETAPKPEEHVPNFPAEFSRILLHTLEREPDRRYADASELARDLDAYVRTTGSPEVAPELARLLSRLFAPEREEQARAVTRLRTAETSLARAPAGSTTTADPIASSIRPTPRRSGRRWAILGVALVGLIGITSAASLARRSAPATTGSAVSPDVTLEMAVEPDVPATVAVAGAVVVGHPARARVPRGGRPVTIQVAASGFQPVELDTVPDQDRLVVIHLSPAALQANGSSATPAIAAPPASPRGTAPPSTEEFAAAAKPVPRAGPKAAKSAPPGAASSGSPKKNRDSLVTDYPF